MTDKNKITNMRLWDVPVDEAISDCTNLLFSGRYKEPPVDKETFKTLLSVCSQKVVMLTNDGYYQQIDGLAMGSPPAPMLTNGWMSKFDKTIKGYAELFSRYMDDILRDIANNEIEKVLHDINNLHPSLKFTTERENDQQSLPFFVNNAHKWQIEVHLVYEIYRHRANNELSLVSTCKIQTISSFWYDPQNY